MIFPELPTLQTPSSPDTVLPVIGKLPVEHIKRVSTASVPVK